MALTTNLVESYSRFVRRWNRSPGSLWAVGFASTRFPKSMDKKHQSRSANLAQPSIVAGQPKGCVLLVEDDRSVRRYLEVTLQRAGYKVIPAKDGLEAMK